MASLKGQKCIHSQGESETPPQSFSTLQRSAVINFFLSRLSALNKIDTRLFEIINTLPHPAGLNKSMEWLALVMNRGDAWLVGVLLVEIFHRKPGKKPSFRFVKQMAVLVWLVTFTVEFPLKLLFRRPRPFAQLAHAQLVGAQPRHFSFPSGHTASSFASAWLLHQRFPRWRWLHWTLALLVACNRVYLGAHFPGDALAGAISGVGLAALYSYLPWFSTPKKQDDPA
ncbi:MAG: phosphatase PAP2 family protein [Caldilineaceae bacterium]|nr:phosphatase PAP2 family protein [Caldilineaceae bacterium]